MNRRKKVCSFLMGVVILCAGIAAAGAIHRLFRQDDEGRQTYADLSGDDSDLRWDLASGFGFAWDSITFSASLPDSSQSGIVDSNTPPHELTISVRFDIYDTNDLVGVAVDSARILELLDKDDKSVPRISDSSDLLRRYVEVRNEQVWDDEKGQYDKLEPSTVTIQIHLDPNETVPSVLSRIEGYVYALYAEDVIEDDIPFEPVGEWVEVASDLEIKVASHTPPPPGPIEYESAPRGSTTRPAAPLALYIYETYVRSKTEDSVRGLGDSLQPDEVFGQYVVVRTKLYDSSCAISVRHEIQSVAGRQSGGPGIYYAFCNGETKQDFHSYDMIRHVIAVNPKEVKIPFTLTNIPIPTVKYKEN